MFSTLVGVFVFSVMLSDLLMTSAFRGLRHCVVYVVMCSYLVCLCCCRCRDTLCGYSFYCDYDAYAVVCVGCVYDEKI